MSARVLGTTFKLCVVWNFEAMSFQTDSNTRASDNARIRNETAMTYNRMLGTGFSLYFQSFIFQFAPIFTLFDGTGTLIAKF